MTAWICGELRRLREAGEPVVAATVTAVRGSTPRGAGARMLVRRDGTIAGSVGGGCGEEQVRRAALGVLQDGRPRFTTVDLTGEMSEDSVTHCGGVMEVFLDRLAWGDRPRFGLSAGDSVEVVSRALEELRTPAAVAVVTGGQDDALAVGTRWVIAGEAPRARAGLGVAGGLPDETLGPLLVQAAAAAIASGRIVRLALRRSEGRWAAANEPAGVPLLIEPLAPAPELVVVGAGHIAQPLATLGRLLDFDVTVIDDRAEFATRARFPDARAVVVGAVDAELRRRHVGPDTFVVLVTRDHQHDEAALRAVVDAPAAYVGMIGSRRRIREVFRRLAEAGVPTERIERVHAPIGLAIGAESPAEIATSIAAELVKVRRAGPGQGEPRPRLAP